MINISTNKQLNIILTNTNKALAEALGGASKKELEVISQNKDLKSIINSIFEKTSKNSTSDKALLELVKNNPTLKNLGNISTNINDLLNSIKSDKNPLPIEKTLKNLLIDIKNLNEPILKQKLENSGVFLESKLKNAQNPQLELKTALKTLLTTLQGSKIYNAKSILQDIKNLLQTPLLKNTSNEILTNPQNDNTKNLDQLVKNLHSLIEKTQIHLKKIDIINTKDFALQLEKTLHKIEPKILTPQDFKLANIQESLTQLSTQLQQSQNIQAKGIFDILDKIIQTLQTIQKSSLTPKASLDQFIDKKLPQDIRNLIDSLKNIIKQSDPIFSKESVKIIDKLSTLNTPEKLSTQHNVKEIVANDLKAILLKTSDELSKSSHPNQSEIIKQLDKLSLAIDYQQLLSHLSNSSAIYLPFSWEQLEDGNINIKKDKQDRFYCDIELKLKEYGELTLKLILYDKNQLNIHIYSDNNDFKNLIKNNIPSLRSALIDAQVTPREIRLFKSTNNNSSCAYNVNDNPIDVGFEVKV